VTPADILERLKELHAKTNRAFPSLGETIDEFERLRAEIKQLREEVETWRDRYEAERQDHEATMKAWDAERSRL